MTNNQETREKDDAARQKFYNSHYHLKGITRGAQNMQRASARKKVDDNLHTNRKTADFGQMSWSVRFKEWHGELSPRESYDNKNSRKQAETINAIKSGWDSYQTEINNYNATYYAAKKPSRDATDKARKDIKDDLDKQIAREWEQELAEEKKYNDRYWFHNNIVRPTLIENKITRSHILADEKLKQARLEDAVARAQANLDYYAPKTLEQQQSQWFVPNQEYDEFIEKFWRTRNAAREIVLTKRSNDRESAKQTRKTARDTQVADLKFARETYDNSLPEFVVQQTAQYNQDIATLKEKNHNYLANKKIAAKYCRQTWRAGSKLTLQPGRKAYDAYASTFYNGQEFIIESAKNLHAFGSWNYHTLGSGAQFFHLAYRHGVIRYCVNVGVRFCVHRAHDLKVFLRDKAVIPAAQMTRDFSVAGGRKIAFGARATARGMVHFGHYSYVGARAGYVIVAKFAGTALRAMDYYGTMAITGTIRFTHDRVHDLYKHVSSALITTAKFANYAPVAAAQTVKNAAVNMARGADDYILYPMVYAYNRGLTNTARKGWDGMVSSSRAIQDTSTSGIRKFHNTLFETHKKVDQPIINASRAVYDGAASAANTLSHSWEKFKSLEWLEGDADRVLREINAAKASRDLSPI